MPLKRFDCDGRDVTELPGLWSDIDVTPYDDAMEEIERLTKERDEARDE